MVWKTRLPIHIHQNQCSTGVKSVITNMTTLPIRETINATLQPILFPLRACPEGLFFIHARWVPKVSFGFVLPGFYLVKTSLFTRPILYLPRRSRGRYSPSELLPRFESLIHSTINQCIAPSKRH